MWHWHGDGWASGDWVGMALMMALVWVPLLLVGLLLLRGVLTGGGHGTDLDPAEEEARRAYARGEIDRERFQQIMRDLRDHSATPR